MNMPDDPKCSEMPPLIKSITEGPSNRDQKESLMEHLMHCLPCVDKFRESIRKRDAQNN